MEGLPQALLEEIVKRITRTNDRNSLSLMSMLLYTLEAEQRDSIRVGCPLCPFTVAVASLCSWFPNLCKMEINYSGWTTNSGMQLDNKGLHMLSACCSSLLISLKFLLVHRRLWSSLSS
uniref:F-box domain-containing protein n=1 Tax=Arundo donax TaxID=35708 RepID=A0A0A9GXJ9_ARUDO